MNSWDGVDYWAGTGLGADSWTGVGSGVDSLAGTGSQAEEQCAAQTHKRAIAVTGRTGDKGTTSGMDGAGTSRLERAETGGLDDAGLGTGYMH